jgi:hypothetical protein
MQQQKVLQSMVTGALAAAAASTAGTVTFTAATGAAATAAAALNWRLQQAPALTVGLTMAAPTRATAA